MSYQMCIQPAVLREGIEYKVIQISDISLHTAKKTPTPSVGKKIQNAFVTDMPARIYAPIQKFVTGENVTPTLELLKHDPNLMKYIRTEEAKGYKVLLSIPKGGIPIVLGKDTIEFINSKNGKRVLRGLAKGKHRE